MPGIAKIAIFIAYASVCVEMRSIVRFREIVSRFQIL